LICDFSRTTKKPRKDEARFFRQIITRITLIQFPREKK